MPSLFRRSFAELLGTFALVFFGAGAVASKYFPEATYGIFGVAVAHGLVLAVMVTALLGISGGHLNPAVTLGLMSVRRTDLRTGLAYIVAQLLGGVLAALLIKVVYPLGVVRPISLGTPSIANAQKRARVAFEFIEKLGAPFYCFHDRDVAPECATLAESNKALDDVVKVLKEEQQRTGIKLLWGTACLFVHPRYMHGAGTSPNADVFAYAAAQVKKAMEAAGKVYEPVIYEGAGHGFVRAGALPDADEANRRAHEQAWVRWKELLGKL